MQKFAQKIGKFVYDLLINVYNGLGSGFSETVYQNAFSIELRERGIEYLREVNLEVFYKGQAVGNDRPDFIILKGKIDNLEIKYPVVIEMKVGNFISNDNRQQLKTYFVSLCQSKDRRLKDIRLGILARILKSEDHFVPERTRGPVEIEVFWFDDIRRGMDLVWRSG